MMRLADVYEGAVRELDAKELRLFLLSEASRLRTVILPDDIAAFVEDHVRIAASLLQNMKSVPGRRRRPNMVRDMLS